MLNRSIHNYSLRNFKFWILFSNAYHLIWRAGWGVWVVNAKNGSTVWIADIRHCDENIQNIFAFLIIYQPGVSNELIQQILPEHKFTHVVVNKLALQHTSMDAILRAYEYKPIELTLNVQYWLFCYAHKKIQ